MQKLRLLYVEDSLRDAHLVLRELKKEGLDVESRVVDSIPVLSEALRDGDWDVVLSDCHMPLLRVEDALKVVRDLDVNLPFIAVSGAIGEEEAVSLLKSGAQDFVSKSKLSRLAPAITREIQEAQGRRERLRAEQALKISEERLQLALTGANDGLWEWNLETGAVYFSPRWKSMLGYEDHELENAYSTWQQRLHEDDRERVSKVIQAALAGEIDRFEIEFRMQHKAGHAVDVLSRASLIVTDGSARRMAGTHVDISERKHQEHEILKSREQLRALSEALQIAREEEKAWIAQEVHDDLGAILTALNVDVHWLRAKIPGEFDRLRAKVDTMGELVNSAAESCSRIVTQLRPSVLDDLGLLAAIEWQAQEFAKRHDIPCTVTSNLQQLMLPRDRSTAVFRIFQESLNNAAKYANASKIEVMLVR
ncbi:MAG: PAS domain-containing protein, partial [Pseudomonadales bacterium]|nr:PAS domain-containing protein [Pseudomonadales bacterium]